MLNIRLFLRTALLLLIAACCSSWGFLVHRTINQLAIYQLPEEMRLFFYVNRSFIVKESVGPDLRRNGDPAEAPRHFIDLEMYGDSAAWKMPLHWNDAVRLYSIDTLRKYGYVPYEVVMVKEMLTMAFRTRNKDSILFYAADIGHYIGDANVPLHTSANYDGQLSDQRGIHNLWESLVPELELAQYNLYYSHQARYLPDPAAAIWEAIRNAHAMVNDVLDQETETSKGFNDSAKYEIQLRNGKENRTYRPAFIKAYADRLGKTVNQQLIKSSSLLADFWFSAWVDAGRPSLSNLLSGEDASAEEKKMRDEYQDYRHNQLLGKNLLIGRHNAAGK